MGITLNSFFTAAIGTMMELLIFYYAYAVLLDIKKNAYPKLVFLYLGMCLLVEVSNYYILGYASFIYVFAMLISMKFFTRESFFKILFIFVMTMIEVMLLELILMPTVGLLLSSELYRTVLVLVIANVINWQVLKKFQMPLTILVEKYEAKYINFLALNALIYTFVYKIIWDYNSDIITKNVIYFVLVMLALVIVNYFIYKEVALISERAKLLEVQDEMRTTLDQMIHDIRAKQHEYHNNLTTIQGFLDTSHPEHAVNQIRYFLDDVYSYDAIDNDLLSIDRDIIKAVLFMKRNEAYDLHINFEFAFYTSLKAIKMLDHEISTILNNLINNAYEAVSKAAKKAVYLELGFDESLQKYYFLTKNTAANFAPEHLSRVTDRNFTTKTEEKGSHGFGLWTIKKIARKYKGLVYVYFEQDDIVFKVTFE